MYKGIEWLKNEIGTEMMQLEPNRKERWSDVKYQTLRSVAQKIHQLGELEVLSQDWIEDNTFVITDEDGDDYAVVENRKLKDKLVPKQELPAIPKYVAEYVELAKSDVTLMRVLEIANRRDELPKWRKEYDWISANDEAFARAWLDGYEVEEGPLYYALIKGHELVAVEGDWTRKYWNLSIPDGRVFPSDRFSRHDKYLTRMSKEEWFELGINDSNADFVKVDE